MGEVFAHSANDVGIRHLFVEHSRSTAALARRFAAPFGAGELAYALGLFHDAGKVDCGWQDRLLTAEATGGRVGGRHWELGAKLLHGAADMAALAVYGHHQGLTNRSDVKNLISLSIEDEDSTRERFFAVVPEARAIVAGRSPVPTAWLQDSFVHEMGVRMVFSALVDADHLDTAAHFRGDSGARLAPPADMAGLVRRFEQRRHSMLASRQERRGHAAIDADRSALYDEVVSHADAPTGVFRLPAPTGSGKTITAAGFALHHAARHGKTRVVVAVPFLTITEQNAQVYRELLGDEVVLEHHSQVDFNSRDHRARLAAENWDASFVVTTTVQLFDSLFGRRPTRSRKLHRLTNAVLVLDEVQALPLSLLLPILDGLRVLTEQFGTTVILTSATQPSFHRLGVWSAIELRELVARPRVLFERLRRVDYEWRVDPRLTLAQVADEVAAVAERQALVVVNTVDQARRMYELLSARCAGVVLHLSTRMCPAHRRAVLAEADRLLDENLPVVVVSTQLIEAGVDIDFPVVFRAMAPAESLQQAAGRANREGARPVLGRVVVFDAADAPVPGFYQAAVSATHLYFGPGRAAPDDLDMLDEYYVDLYTSVDVERGRRAVAIQRCRERMDFQGVAEGPVVNAAENTRDARLAFRMIDEDTVPVVITCYGDVERIEDLLGELADPDRRSRETFRALRPFVVALPRRLAEHEAIRPLCRPIVDGIDLRRWDGVYHDAVGVHEWVGGEEMIV